LCYSFSTFETASFYGADIAINNCCHETGGWQTRQLCHFALPFFTLNTPASFLSLAGWDNF
jgi:hypothetical protein